MADLHWTNETRRLGQLKLWDRNPRQIKQAEARRLVESLDEFGQIQPIAIDPDNVVIDGHQRDKVWSTAKQYGPDYVVDVRMASRALTEKEREKLTALLHVGAVGEFDWDQLASWDSADLQSWGFDADTLAGWRTDVAALGNLLESEGDGAGADDKYSRNIEAPIYTPKGDKPPVSDLFDDTRTKALISEIDAADLPEDEKEFLRLAAGRHTVFSYKRIAEYYAHSDEPTQRLMENSALVIIDFNRAIELGYVKLAQDIAEQYGREYGDD